MSAIAIAPHTSHSLPPYRFLLASSCAAAATLIPILAHQTGQLAHLIDPPGAIFNSDLITESEAAHPFGVPDAALGLGSYAATIALVCLARKRPRVRTVLAAKLLGDGCLAGFNVVRQIVSFRQICSWCTATALCTAITLIASRRLIAQDLNRITTRFLDPSRNPQPQASPTRNALS